MAPRDQKNMALDQIVKEILIFWVKLPNGVFLFLQMRKKFTRQILSILFVLNFVVRKTLSENF